MEEAPFKRASGLTIYRYKANYSVYVQLNVTDGAANSSIPFI